MITETTEQLRSELGRERYALSSLLEFARTLRPDLGAHGIIRSVQRTIMGKALIMSSFAYLAKDLEGGGEFVLLSRSGFADVELPDVVGSDLVRNLPKRSGAGFGLTINSPDTNEVIAVLGFGKPLMPGNTIERETVFLESLSVLTGIALTNARLFESEKERERLESELRLARDIQQSLFPKVLPTVDGIAFGAYTNPSELVGGDYYDIIRINQHVSLIVIADVVGKGVTAAITMSTVQSALRALVSLLRNGTLTLLEITTELNRLICESTSPERFVTAVLALVDSESRSVEAAVCGHPRPLIIEGLDLHELESTGIPLGIIPDFVFTTTTRTLAVGARILLYTDGLTEATIEGAELGSEGLIARLRHAGAGVMSEQELIDTIVSMAKVSFADDLTLVAAKLDD